MNKTVLHVIRAAVLCALSAAWASAEMANAPRRVVSLDKDWAFHLGAVPEATDPEFRDNTWARVDVPHDYLIEGSFDPQPLTRYDGMPEDWHILHGFLSLHPAVYRRTLELSESTQGKCVWLEFDGVFSNSRYWLNGKEIGSQYSGYTRSRFDITAARKPGKNVLVVQVDPRYDGWWYEGGGIYRHVRLVIANQLHVAPDGVFVASTTANPENPEPDATAQLNLELANESNRPQSATVANEIVDDTGRVVAASSSTHEVPTGPATKIAHTFSWSKARLWAPDHPSLYSLRTTVSADGRVLDQVTTRFGVRQVRFDPDRGFSLNGKGLKLRGVNMHEDHAGVGVAMPDGLFTWRLERLKELGCNAIRLSHNPVTPFLLEECDRLGFLVIAENRHFGDTYVDQTPKETKAVEHRDLSALILRDRNHPSIIMWSLCNEQWIQNSPESAAIARAMIRRVRELDPTRPATAAMNGGFDSPDGMGSALDVLGVNYHPDVYDAVHSLFPKTPLVATEIASEISTRGVYTLGHWDNYFGDRERGYIAAYSTTAGPGGQTVEHAWPPVQERPFMAGGFVWAAFDYRGEPRPFAWPVVNSHYGVMDLCGFPKDSFYYYQAAWTDSPVLHLFPHWNWPGQEGREIPVWVHSNCESVELFLNGVSLGEQTVLPLHHLEWKVKYAPGRLVAVGRRHGVSIEEVRETTGPAAAIRLTADRSALAADNVDLSVIKVEIVDAQNRVVPTADNRVSFRLKGPAKLIGVGNGDPSSHEPDHANARSAFNGLAQALVQVTDKPGEITFTAESGDLRSTAITLQSR